MKKHFVAMISSIVIPSALIFGVGVVFAEKALAAEHSTLENLQSDDEVPRRSRSGGISFEKIEFEQIDRVEKLRKFFQKYNSPLENHAKTFVEVADKYGIDYRIMPAIAGVESTFGKFDIPKTHNPFGWGGGRIEFSSFDEAIEGVGKGLHDIYISKGRTTIEKIAPVYCPPNAAGWARKVNHFADQISAM